MMSNDHHRRFITPVGPSRKRKDRAAFEVPKPPPKLARPNIPRPGPASLAQEPLEPASNNQLLAGCLAHEFLTKGTLFGQLWDPARAEAFPVAVESRRVKFPGSSQKAKAEPSTKAEPNTEKYQRYVEVSNMLKTDGAHLPGIVNPAQLAPFLQL
ncbi:Cortactin-binding protein like [Actinidia chinensis var. chinensis]|uniref:Cortactin-binding protein like n=1 Tax=Actinidia chinensis var. chinensis TaxID=1590841 RepID=A0A2R6PEC5_ACTCC|nr:Cortactin-binding protein like [Actinidia chinensis var. chinensis]